jgi:uncharacterized protein YcbK (DUF882 family)
MRAALVTAVLLWAHTASAENATRFQSKKDRRLKQKAETGDQSAFRRALDLRIGRQPPPIVNIYNTWTHETLVVEQGSVEPPLDSAHLNKFLRCHFTNAPTSMDERLFPVLLQAAKRFGVQRVEIISGFRDPKYNLMLRKKGHQVARLSQHTLGHAVDFRLPGIPIKRLHSWARSLRLGGVGFYRSSKFIHVDVGRIRYWTGK